MQTDEQQYYDEANLDPGYLPDLGGGEGQPEDQPADGQMADEYIRDALARAAGGIRGPSGGTPGRGLGSVHPKAWTVAHGREAPAAYSPTPTPTEPPEMAPGYKPTSDEMLGAQDKSPLMLAELDQAQKQRAQDNAKVAAANEERRLHPPYQPPAWNSSKADAMIEEGTAMMRGHWVRRQAAGAQLVQAGLQLRAQEDQRTQLSAAPPPRPEQWVPGGAGMPGTLMEVGSGRTKQIMGGTPAQQKSMLVGAGGGRQVVWNPNTMKPDYLPPVAPNGGLDPKDAAQADYYRAQTEQHRSAKNLAEGAALRKTLDSRVKTATAPMIPAYNALGAQLAQAKKGGQADLTAKLQADLDIMGSKIAKTNKRALAEVDAIWKKTRPGEDSPYTAEAAFAQGEQPGGGAPAQQSAPAVPLPPRPPRPALNQPPTSGGPLPVGGAAHQAVGPKFKPSSIQPYKGKMMLVGPDGNSWREATPEEVKAGQGQS